MNTPAKPTNVRFRIVTVTTLAAFLMYLDRVFFANVLASESFKADFHVDEGTKGNLFSAFFFAYALAQMPAGWLSDRFGARPLMSIYILLWSACTALTGFAGNLTVLILSRIGCGLAEAGAYPTSGSLLSRWVPIRWRGTASSIVSLGGRLGGAAAPVLTAMVILHLGNWRWAGWVYGTFGILLALLFWMNFRERPEDHPRCNAAERTVIAEGRAPVSTAPVRFPLLPLLRSFSYWMMCVSQFTTNVGWAFLVTWMPNYLRDVKHVSEAQSGWFSTGALLIGVVGVFLGGFFTDFCTQRFGSNLGRILPIAGTRFLAAAAYFSALWLDSPLALTIAFGVVAFATDAGLPAAWAYMQDVGGRQVGPVFGWANMWGNLGAAWAPKLLAWVNVRFDTNQDWHESLLVCAGAFVLSGIASLFLNATRPVVRG